MPETTSISKRNAPAFKWRDVCDGWTLVDAGHLHVIQERMPPGTYELRHFHEETRQFYFVLEGRATIETDAARFELAAGEGIEIQPRLTHQMRNESGADLEFLVISTQRPREDRTDV